MAIIPVCPPENLQRMWKAKRYLPEDEPPYLKGINVSEEVLKVMAMLLKEKAAGQKGKWCSVVIVSDEKQPSAVKNNDHGTGMFRSMNQRKLDVVS